MIFSSGLGSVEKQSTDVAIKSIANHLRKLQDELEYRLSNLDSSNINEIDTDETVIRGTTVTMISQSADEIAELKLHDQQLTASVQGLGNQMSSLQMQAGSIQMAVEDLNASMSQTVRLSADGLTVTNAAGSTLTIDGGQINAKTIKTEDLNLTGKITFADLDAETQAAINKDNTKEYLASIGITEITSGSVKAPLIEGGEIRGAEIYGGIFGDLVADNYMKVETRGDLATNGYQYHVMEHHVGDVDSSVPVTSMGWMAAEVDGKLEAHWYLSSLGSVILSRSSDGTICPRGTWDFSGCTVSFAGAIVNFTGAVVVGL